MKYTTIPEMFIQLCEKYKSKKYALQYKINGVYSGLTHDKLREKVECFALGLLNLGIHSQDRIGLASENRIEWAIADLAIACIGAIDVPVFPTLTSKQEEFIFNDSQVAAIIVSNNFQLNKVLEIKDRIASLRHIIVMNNEFDSRDVNIKSMDYIINRGSGIRTPDERRQIIEKASYKIQPDDLLTIIYTSGTTGNPKGVMLTHRNVMSNVTAAIETVGFKEDDRFLSFLPWCHAYERATGYYAAFTAGATITIAESVDTLAANIKEIKPTYMTTVPKLLETVKKKIFSAMDKEPVYKQKLFNWAVNVGTSYVRLEYGSNGDSRSIFLKTMFKIANQLILSKIQEKICDEPFTFVSGGAVLSPIVSEFFIAIGFIVLEGYGLTEASPVVAVNDAKAVEIGTVGKPLIGVEIKIADDGEILVKGPNVMKGYYNDEPATRACIDEEGWLYTGDIGKITAMGNLKITDRKKYIFVSSGGKNIAPQPIENLLAQSPFIEQCILIGDNREFNSALISPDFEQLGKLADNFGIQYQNVNELISNPKIITTIKNEIDRLQKDLAKYERVRKFSLLSQPFTIENGELTPKLSVKRHEVEKKYSGLIEQMYGI